MDGVIESFDRDKNMRINKTDDQYKTGQVKGVSDKKFPAIYTTAEITYVANPSKDFEMKLYLFVVDCGVNQYFIQATTTKPVRGTREKQILDMIKSLIARK